MSQTRRARRKPLDLRFGADIVELKASKSSRYKDLDGRTYAFEFAAPGIPQLPSFLARAMELGASKNERAVARKSTNTTTFRALKRFGSWVEQQTSATLSDNLLRRFRDHLFSTLSVGYAYGIYTVVARSMQLLMEDKAIARFTIPENATRTAVVASSTKSGSTLASSIDGIRHDGESVDDINESMMKSWLSASWIEINRLCDRIELAKQWRSEVDENWAPPSWLQPARHISANREDMVKAIVQIIAKKFGNRIPPSFLQDIKDTPDDPWSLMIDKLRKKAQRIGKTIFPYEIVSYFFPTAPLAGLCLSGFCCAQVNPDSAARLKISDLVDDEHPDRKRLLWHKGRAGGPQTAMPFPIGSPGSRTIPRLWERFMLASSELREGTPKEESSYFFIWASSDPSQNPIRLFGADKPVAPAWGPTKAFLQGQLRELPTSTEALDATASLRDCIDQINLALLRSTAINISAARLNRDFSEVAKMDGRRSPAVLETHYLNNSQTREHLDSDVRKAQAFLLNWVHSTPVVLPPDETVISQAVGVDQATAKSLVDENLNLGNGASLLNDQAIFIDTPINALRIIQWLRHVAEAESRMVRENPGRWQRMFQPQIHLFQEALHAFSRPSVAAAKVMDQEIELPFPPIH